MARNDIKYSKLEEGGAELFGPTEHVPTAQDIAFSHADYESDNVAEALGELDNAPSDGLLHIIVYVVGTDTLLSSEYFLHDMNRNYLNSEVS